MCRLTVALVAAFCFFCLVGASLDIDDDRIVGGVLASINELPHQVSVMEHGSHVCGGSIIAANMILTAAHCVDDINPESNDLQIRAGSAKHDSGGVVKDVKAFKIHPMFNADTMEYDCAILKLASALVFSNTIKEIQLSDKPVEDGAMATVSGWGLMKNNGKELSPDLKKTELKLMTRDSCMKTDYKNNIRESMFCASGKGTDACEGDSGGPMIDLDSFIQIGIVSFGFDCASAKYPGVYSLVSKCLPFITKMMKTL